MNNKTTGCIYCGSKEQLTAEHYLPRGLGTFRGMVPLHDKICITCNTSFSVLEEQFCRSSPEAFFREMLAIRGRKGHKKISPFHRGSAGAERFVLTGKLPGEDFEVHWELNRGTKTITQMRQTVFITDEGDTHIVPIPDDMKDPVQFRERFDELSIGKTKKARIFCKDNESDWICSLLSGLEIDYEVEWLDPPDAKEVEVECRLTSLVTDKYFRALAKIGFHYFLKHFIRFHGSEGTFAEIRKFITQGGNIDQFVSWSSEPLMAQGRYGFAPRTYGHLLVAEVDHLQLRAALQFFLGPDTQPLVYTIKIGTNPSRIHYDQQCGHFFSYFESDREDGYDGEMSEVTPVRKSLLI